MAFEITKVQEDYLGKIISKINPFNDLSPGEINMLVLNSVRIHLKKGDKLYDFGVPTKSVYVLMDGAIKISTPNFGFKEVIHDMINAPRIFGFQECASKQNLNKNAICISPILTCYAIPFNVIKSLMKENSSFNFQLFNQLSEQILEKENRVEQLMTCDARERVVNFIKNQARQKGIRIGYEILLKHSFTQQDIADFAGTSRQTVTNIRKELKDKNKIHVERRSILIRDINDFL